MPWWKCAFVVHVYRCSGGSEEVDGGVVWELPGERFEGLWESLEFEDGVKTALLAYIESGCLFSTLGVDDGLIGWNRYVHYDAFLISCEVFGRGEWV